eukprot:COSAG02_NODE_48439_length_333_cov_2.363248_1_plen_49_part_10
MEGGAVRLPPLNMPETGEVRGSRPWLGAAIELVTNSLVYCTRNLVAPGR